MGGVTVKVSLGQTKSDCLARVGHAAAVEVDERRVGDAVGDAVSDASADDDGDRRNIAVRSTTTNTHAPSATPAAESDTPGAASRRLPW